ncbi:MAG: ABC transporter substrate-binding protein [Desulfopila sp.]|jgi:iron complex transport system substrate-binding protein|nr:ABC transporter substrate-binding protein [Desulfopila sp.]
MRFSLCIFPAERFLHCCSKVLKGIVLCTVVFSCISIPAWAEEQSDKPPYRRIISLYSAHTENLASMGAAEQLVGISPSDNYPEEILHLQKFSYREDPERFIAARPDLILVRPMIERSYPQLMAKLREAGITIVSLQPTSVAEIFEYWRELGRLSGRSSNAEKMIAGFTTELAQIKKQVDTIPQSERPRVYFESIHRKMKTFAPSSIALFALEQAGGRNIATDARQVRDTNIASYSKERILAHAADIDVFIAQQGRMNQVDIETIRNETGFMAIKAVRQNNIVLVDEHLVSRPTLRLIEGIRELHSRLYPDRIADIGSMP